MSSTNGSRTDASASGARCDDAPVALVTGAAGGIGAAIALAFADRGWRVYATDVETPPRRVRERCRCLDLDVTDADRCRAVVDRIVGETGRLDCLVNNAGYAAAGPVEDIPVDAVRDQFDVLVHGPHALVRAALPVMRERDSGRIVTVSSVLALTTPPGAGAYAAGKAACESLHDALRVELRGTGVSVTLVEPAWVATGFGESARASLAERDRTAAYDRTYAALDRGWILDGNPLAVTPDRVADAVLRAATTERPRARYPVGGFARFVRWSHALPASVVDPIHAAYARATAFLGRFR